MNIGIIGHGFVGKAIEYGFHTRFRVTSSKSPNDVFIYDKYKYDTSLREVIENSSIIFICLPTPFFDDDLKIDLSICDKMISDICDLIPEDSGKIIVVKSTVEPGSTKRWSDEHKHASFIFNPEFLTEANYLHDFINTERIVVGSENDWAAQKVIMLYRSCPWFYDTPIMRMHPSAAELVKYQCNIILATRVAVSNVVYDMCNSLGVNYDDVKDAVGMDRRITSSHISVTSERGFGGKCFPKDLGAFIGCCRRHGVDARLLSEVYEYNLRIRQVYDWLEIAGASVGGRKYDDSSV